MAFLTESQLRSYAHYHAFGANDADYLVESVDQAVTSIFLSHSHKDKEMVQGIIQILALQGIRVYVDWNDTDMPRETNRRTAERIKEKIEELDLFVLLATKTALASRWVPWEVGVADQAKGESQVLIVPVKDDDGRFIGREFLRLYRRLVQTPSGDFAVFEPTRTNGGLLLESYLRRAG